VRFYAKRAFEVKCFSLKLFGIYEHWGGKMENGKWKMENGK